MQLQSIRFCAITPEADQLVEFLGLGLGFPCEAKPLVGSDPDSPQGGIFRAGESRIEVWPDGEGMPAGIMLQVIVDDAEEFAAHARANGLQPQGPMEAHGEKIYFLMAPGGLAVTFQSKLADEPIDPHALADEVKERHVGGDGTEWFDDFYAEAKAREIDPPWVKRAANPNLADWLDAREFEGQGKRAVVVGCGLGDDAEELAARGFEVTAIDVSENAIQMAKERFPETRVEYRCANLLSLPPELLGAFDFTWEAYTLQSLPVPTRHEAMAGIARLSAPGGTLLVAAYARPEDAEPSETPPWPLSPSELRGFAEFGLTIEELESYIDEKRSARPVPHHRVELIRG
jgi:SAM-dependent methyltransferase